MRVISKTPESGICCREQKKKLLRQKLRHKRSIIFLIWAVTFAYLSYSSAEVKPLVKTNLVDNINLEPLANHFSSVKLRSAGRNRRNVLELSASEPNIHYLGAEAEGDLEGKLIPGVNCTLPAIEDFPPDLFTQSERQGGAIVIHFLVSAYIFYTIAIVCDDYFVPSIEVICEQLTLPSDVAGATFMAIATSSPELFTNVIGTFITQGDIGVGTIVGSAVFNILAIAACCGLAAKTELQLEWWPLTRDCLFYSISVILLIIVLLNQKVFWYEALVLVCFYFVYIGVMYKNTAFRKAAEKLVFGIGSKSSGKSRRHSRRTSEQMLVLETEETPLIGGDTSNSNYVGSLGSDEKPTTVAFSESTKSGSEKEYLNRDADDGENENEQSSEIRDEILIAKALHDSEVHAEEEKEEFGIFKFPRGESIGVWIEWIAGWPIRLVLTITIPDCREQRLRRWYPLTFIMCIAWIASLSYIVSWMMTVIGHTFQIPDSVMGLTFIAAGTSVPEAVSSIIVARQGLGAMGISNSIGSNTFDILICLGLPWLIRTASIASSEVNYVFVNSSGIGYSTITLMATLFIIYTILACNRFVLDKKVSFIALAMYAAFLIFSSLVELNVFSVVNLPTCES